MTRDGRMTLTVAVACVLSSVVLYPLFTGSAWFYAGAGAVITVAACGVLSRLRKLPVVVCLAIGVAGLLLYLNLVFEARHSWVSSPPRTRSGSCGIWPVPGSGTAAGTLPRRRSRPRWSCSRPPGLASPPWPLT